MKKYDYTCVATASHDKYISFWEKLVTREKKKSELWGSNASTTECGRKIGAVVSTVPPYISKLTDLLFGPSGPFLRTKSCESQKGLSPFLGQAP
jgi:WD40 repeat protein